MLASSDFEYGAVENCGTLLTIQNVAPEKPRNRAVESIGKTEALPEGSTPPQMFGKVIEMVGNALQLGSGFSFSPARERTDYEDAWDEIAKSIVTGERPNQGKLLRYIQTLNSRIEDIGRERDRKLSQIDAFDGFKKWMHGPFTLQKQAGSVWHKLQDCFRRDAVLAVSEHDVEAIRKATKKLKDFSAIEPQIFIVQHDWASAFSGATDFADGEFRLPFEVCCFEFMISGRHAIVLVHETEECPVWGAIFIAGHGHWIGMPIGDLSAPADGGEELQPFYDMVHFNVKAICVALDSEIAYKDVTRAPVKLNESLRRKNEPPIRDFYTVNLARRSHVKPASGGHDTGTKKRLHFRRGHWRRYPTHKTWIRWTLVGDPDLGFIDKQYRA